MAGLPRYSTTNLLKGLASGSISAPTTATGFASTDLCDGTVPRSWRASAAGTSFTFTFTLAAPSTVSFAAAFDVRGTTTGPSRVSSIEVFTAPDGSTWTSRGTLTLNSRGDGSLSFTGVPSTTHVRFVVSTSASEKIDVGEFWTGSRTDFPTSGSAISIDDQRATIVNETPGGAVFAAQDSKYRARFQIVFPPMITANDDLLTTFFDAVDGALNAFVLIPDLDQPASVYHGRASDSFGRTIGLGGVRSGRVLEFTESGRAVP